MRLDKCGSHVHKNKIHLDVKLWRHILCPYSVTVYDKNDCGYFHSYKALETWTIYKYVLSGDD